MTSNLAPLAEGSQKLSILSCMQMRHGECKTVGSKLVAVTVSVDDDGTAQSCHISGDFFIESVSDAESHALLHDLERALISDDSLRSVLDAHPSCQIIGTDEIAIKTAYSRAVSSNLPPLAGAPAQRVGWAAPMRRTSQHPSIHKPSSPTKALNTGSAGTPSSLNSP